MMIRNILKTLGCLFFLQLLPAFEVSAQKIKTPVLPRVGIIKNYPATGLMVGCGNSYYYFADQVKKASNYVFISNGEGTVAWMNLNGRDTSLKFVKRSRSEEPPFRTYYRWKKVSILVLVEYSKPPDESSGVDHSMLRKRVILRQGRATKTIQMVGEADC